MPDDKADDQGSESETSQGAETQAPSVESQIADFENSQSGDQAKTLRELAKRTNYDISKYLTAAKKASPMEMSQQKRTELFKHLLSLVPAEDDIPFDIGRK
jgi:hypothetical protein